MKAVLMHESGVSGVLRFSEVDHPRAPSGRLVLVRLHAAGVNPIDTKLRSRGTYYPEKMPAILGCDGAGVVEAVGEEVSRFKAGDRVYFFFGGIGGEQGCYAEYNLVPEDYLVVIPDSLDFNHAAAAPLVVITAWEALYDRARIQVGQHVLIQAGAGGVGHVAIQLAKEAGCKVITTVSDADKEELVRKLGADEVIRYRDEDVAGACHRWTDGKGVDVVLDTVGSSDAYIQAVEALRPYGQLVTLLQPDALDWKKARLKNLTVSMELMLSPPYFGWEEARLHQTRILENAVALMVQGCLQIIVSDILPLEQAARAHERIEQGGMQGKLVLSVY